MAEGHRCTSRSPDVSLRGAKRRGNLAVHSRIVGKPSAKTQLPCTTPDFRQNVFDISGAGGYNKDVETQTVATNITYLFPICEFRHSQISESSGCDRRLTFFLSEANRRSGRDARRSKEPRTGLEVLCISPPLGYFPQELYTCLHSAPAG